MSEWVVPVMSSSYIYVIMVVGIRCIVFFLIIFIVFVFFNFWYSCKF